ncbi:ankyrin repeat domain-containing protein [Polynucleobacter sp. AP-Latsch-80-C2]|jgi:ankyrin repeat protein|uniref:ankyrin repeat domain-containing protein n=1 Tax=Polynucleobacter sp. AP-Latsch-80-C2 TaxID=2576931 RepID=UPI001C0B8C31|nr:ankyrin repeat domain-containing protein [Polynucleobacter sp. AP-Latsch-80-C2]MBU3624133.1 ankyrin repeat domain-containing protein [Polynucleobacter sp. AP-Latsch-80-C2]
MRNIIIFSIILLSGLLSSKVALSQTETQRNDFVKAAKFDDVSTVKALIKQGISPNIVDENGNPMLVLAIKDHSYQVIELLLSSKGMDVDLSNKQGETPLMMASINGEMPIVKALIVKNKAQIDHIGWTPLHYASAKGHLDIASFLILNGANVNSLSLGGTTPLMMAVQSGNELLVKLLLDKGADLKLLNAEGISAIDIADIYNKPAISDGLRSRWQKLYKQDYTSALKPVPN